MLISIPTMIIIVLALFVTFISCKEITDLSKGSIDDISRSMKSHPIKKHSLAHQDVKLDCQRPNMPEMSEESMFSWLFYPSQYSLEPGKEAISYPLCGGTDLQACGRRLVLQNVNSTSSGVYKCSIVKSEGAGYTLTSIPVVTFHLEVRDHDPKFIEGPKHITVADDAGATLGCRIQSEVPLTIKWFKRDNNPLPNATIIRYNNNTYRPVMNVENHRDGNIYISELIYKRAFKNDSGIYACSFLSPTGQILYQEGSIDVQQTIVVFSTLVQEKWEIFAGLLMGVILVLVTVGCMIILCFKKMLEKVEDPEVDLGVKPSQKGDFDGNDTSEYEHVIL